MTTFTEVLAYIQDQATDNEISMIFQAGNNRAKTLRQRAGAANLADLKVGDTVTLSGLKPKYLNDLTGTVQRIAGGKVLVEFDDASRFVAGSRYGSSVNVPPQCVTKVAS